MNLGPSSSIIQTVSSLTHHPTSDLHPSTAQLLLATLSSEPHAFLQPPPTLHAAAVVLAKRYLDPLATSTSEAHARRLESLQKKRKRGDPDGLTSQNILRLRELHIEGFEISQIWEQARRVLDASRKELENSLSDVFAYKSSGGVVSTDAALHRPDRNADGQLITNGEDEKESTESTKSSELSEGGEETAEEDYDASENVLSEGSVGSSFANEDGDEEGENIEDPSDEGDDESQLKDGSEDVFVPDINGLNDGFFSIDEFNKQSGLLEQMDARGETLAEDDEEEEIDWHADPMAMTPSRNPRKSKGKEDDAEKESSDEEDGPTFGNADLNAPETDDSGSDADEMQIDSINNTNDIKYADFFAPPPRKAPKPSRRRALPKTQPPEQPSRRSETEDDIQRTISAVRRDIFEDDDGASGNEEENSDHDPSAPPPSRRSRHEIAQARLAAEIRRLEAANVAKRDWTLSGEARAADRPINSLLEEDLDFERAGKPVPVITNEVSEDIETMIKRRILAREFDEVIRRRPGNLATETTRRGRFELDDSKPQQSLAEIYEAEHLRTTNPNTYVDATSTKLKQDTDAAEALWKEVSAKLDALCSLHYRPKPPQASIRVVADVPAINIEDARPGTGADMGGGATSMLAPQEIYVTGEDRSKEDKKSEIITKGGVAVSREEMEQDTKKRRRRRTKERIRKSGGDKALPAAAAAAAAAGGVTKNVTNGGKNKKTATEKEMMSQLKKGGVRIIGKKGDIRDINGKKLPPSTTSPHHAKEESGGLGARLKL
ncbi:U3 snoRNP protein [Peltigera leucophlebia]|nr:U3 snoRNP protein [Peltigera leucophlebia]